MSIIVKIRRKKQLIRISAHIIPLVFFLCFISFAIDQIPFAWLPALPLEQRDLSLVLWRIEYLDSHYSEIGPVRDELARHRLHRSSRILLVDMDETLRTLAFDEKGADAKSLREEGGEFPPNIKLIEQIKNVLSKEIAHVAIVTLTKGNIRAVRDFLRVYLPDHQNLIPVIYLDRARRKFDSEAHQAKFLSFHQKYMKNIHALIAVQIFSPFLKQGRVKMALVDDAQEIRDKFNENVRADLSTFDQSLPKIESVTAIHPGYFKIPEGKGLFEGEWIHSEAAIKEIQEFMTPDPGAKLSISQVLFRACMGCWLACEQS